MVHGKATADAIELSALRQPELLPLVVSLSRLDLRAFVYFFSPRVGSAGKEPQTEGPRYGCGIGCNLG